MSYNECSVKFEWDSHVSSKRVIFIFVFVFISPYIFHSPPEAKKWAGAFCFWADIHSVLVSECVQNISILSSSSEPLNTFYHELNFHVNDLLTAINENNRRRLFTMQVEKLYSKRTVIVLFRFFTFIFGGNQSISITWDSWENCAHLQPMMMVVSSSNCGSWLTDIYGWINVILCFYCCGESISVLLLSTNLDVFNLITHNRQSSMDPVLPDDVRYSSSHCSVHRSHYIHPNDYYRQLTFSIHNITLLVKLIRLPLALCFQQHQNEHQHWNAQRLSWPQKNNK